MHSAQAGVPPGYMDSKGVLKARIPDSEVGGWILFLNQLLPKSLLYTKVQVIGKVSSPSPQPEADKDSRKAELERGYA